MLSPSFLLFTHMNRNFIAFIVYVQKKNYFSEKLKIKIKYGLPKVNIPVIKSCIEM